MSQFKKHTIKINAVDYVRTRLFDLSL